jgi:hypothetical protein
VILLAKSAALHQPVNDHDPDYHALAARDCAQALRVLLKEAEHELRGPAVPRAAAEQKRVVLDVEEGPKHAVLHGQAARIRAALVPVRHEALGSVARAEWAPVAHAGLPLAALPQQVHAQAHADFHSEMRDALVVPMSSRAAVLVSD